MTELPNERTIRLPDSFQVLPHTALSISQGPTGPRVRWRLAGFLYWVATGAQERVIEGQSDAPGGIEYLRDAVVAVAFSVSAVEAFVNEVIEILADELDLHDSEDALQAAKELRRFRIDRASTMEKLDRLYHDFSGRRPRRRSQPYRDFMRLISLRNAITHVDPSKDADLTFDPERGFLPPAAVRDLIGKRLLNPPPEGGVSTWIGWLRPGPIATWACSTAAATVQMLLDAGEGWSGTAVEAQLEGYRKSFTPPA